jgi:metallophosphoesterase superfamily enzyme
LEEQFMAQIRAVVVEGDRQHGYKRVQVLFGTNYFLEIVENDGRVEFLLGAHHTGFKADASELNGELHQYISEIQQQHPSSAFEQD